MVNGLVSVELATESLFHHPSVFTDLPTITPNTPVSVVIDVGFSPVLLNGTISPIPHSAPPCVVHGAQRMVRLDPVFRRSDAPIDHAWLAMARELGVRTSMAANPSSVHLTVR